MIKSSLLEGSTSSFHITWWVITQTNPHVSLVPNLVYIRWKCRRCSGKKKSVWLKFLSGYPIWLLLFFFPCVPACLCPFFGPVEISGQELPNPSLPRSHLACHCRSASRSSCRLVTPGNTRLTNNSTTIVETALFDGEIGVMLQESRPSTAN